MSDNLVKRLRAAAKHPMMDNNCKADVFDVADASDRIEELEKACKEWAEVSQSNYQRAKAAEAKLAIAVGVLEYIKNTLSLYSAKEALAKIKGEQY